MTVSMTNFDRQYVFTASPPGGSGFSTSELHIKFSIEKSDLSSQNTAKISLWNLSASQIATLGLKDCKVILKAGYGERLPVAFEGSVAFVKSRRENADVVTEVEAIDGRVELRDTFISLGYAEGILNKKVLDDTAAQMGLPISYSYNAKFASFPNGFSCIGKASEALDKACECSGLSWSIQNGVVQVKMIDDVMNPEVFLLSPETGLFNIPQDLSLSCRNTDFKEQTGWDVEYLLNAAININDSVMLQSKYASGVFRVYSITIDGDNLEGSWQCTTRLLEV